MKNKSMINRTLYYAVAALALILVGGGVMETSAQNGRDPFATPEYAKPKVVRPSTPGAPTSSVGSLPGAPPVKKGPMVVEAPPIEARIDYYKRVREQAAVGGQPIPKVTSVLLLSEMSVTGIFRTPRGMAAMVEATPIKLSYTIYPGEKFFDGQLVAVEENRLVFRRVVKWSNGKFVASVENMALREYSLQQDIQGTTPPGESSASRPQRASSAESQGGTPSSTIVSPLEEMNSQAKDGDSSETSKSKTPKRKAVSNKKRRSN